MFRCASHGNCYGAGIMPYEGHNKVYFVKWTNGEPSAAINPTPFSDLTTTLNVHVTINGNKMVMYINGVYMTSYVD